jgi:S-adenosylmethionine uptake transporter
LAAQNGEELGGDGSVHSAMGGAMGIPKKYLPIAAAALGIALFSMMDAVMKASAMAVGAYLAMLVRSVMGALVMLPIWRMQGGGWPDAVMMRLHALRGAVSAGMAFTFFWGLVRIPMAEGIALSFIAPLIALFLAAVVLGERIRRAAIGASLLGLAGVAVIASARMQGAEVSHDAAWGMAAILLSAVLYAGNLILQRMQALQSGPTEVAFFQSLWVSAVLLPFLPLLKGAVPVFALGWLAVAALLAVVSLMLLSWAYARAEAQMLLPVEYSAFIWSALMGFWMFGEEVGAATVVGAGLIVIGCWWGARNGSGDVAHSEQVAL